MDTGGYLLFFNALEATFIYNFNQVIDLQDGSIVQLQYVAMVILAQLDYEFRESFLVNEKGNLIGSPH